jgi:hypothetical protein
MKQSKKLYYKPSVLIKIALVIGIVSMVVGIMVGIHPAQAIFGLTPLALFLAFISLPIVEWVDLQICGISRMRSTLKNLLKAEKRTKKYERAIDNFCYATKKIKSRRAILPLKELLNTYDGQGEYLPPEIKVEIATTLCRLGDEEGKKILADIVLDNQNNLAINKCLNDNRVVAQLALRKAMEYKKWPDRKIAAQKLKDLKWNPRNKQDEILYNIAVENWPDCVGAGNAAVDPLCEALMLEAGSEANRISNLIPGALAQIGDSKAVGPLIKALKQQKMEFNRSRSSWSRAANDMDFPYDEKDFCEGIIKALAVLTGEDLGPDPQSWEQWLQKQDKKPQTAM